MGATVDQDFRATSYGKEWRTYYSTAATVHAATD